MSTDGAIKSSQLRHALRTPLNQISGYSDMLIEDLSCEISDNVRQALHSIRGNGREILDLLQKEIPQDRAEISHEHVTVLRQCMEAPLSTITVQLATLVSDASGQRAGLNMADVMRIGSAVAELLEFTRGDRELPIAAEPVALTIGMEDAVIGGEVLVVDDNPGNRDLLVRMLERHGLHAWTAPDGESALRQIETRQLDLILLDLMMPGINGIEVLDRIKADPLYRSIPVIMLSALDETSRVIQCLERGAEDYVVKPFDPVLLFARLRSSLERSRLRLAEAMRVRELQGAYEKLRDNEQRLQESEERLRLATEAADVGIWYYYSRQKNVLMTPVAKRLFGLTGDDPALHYDQLRNHIHPDDRTSADHALTRAVNKEEEYEFEFRVVWPDQSIHWISSRGSAQCHGAEKEIRLAGVTQDITRRKQAEEALIQAHKLESIGLLAGGIAHDFNNLLTGIIGSASFVIDNLPEDDSNAEMLRNVINAGERAADLTRQLLAYSGKGKFTVHRLDLSKLVNEIAVLLRTSISRAVTLERNLEEDLPKIEGDSTQIQQIIMNLVINGSEAIVGEGAVRLRTGVATLGATGREHLILGEDVAPGDYVYLEVSDTGSGMDPEILSKIFEPFFTTKFTGRGMGLAAVFGIVRGHEGALEVKTAPGAGSAFRIYFPPAPGQSIRKQPRVAKILFVDDEPVVRLLGKTALERAGYTVIPASTGEEAFRMLQDYRDEIALVVLDLTMPGWTGFDTLHRLKQVSPKWQLILSSGFSEDELRSRFPGQHIPALLQKPYSASVLVARVKELLG